DALGRAPGADYLRHLVATKSSTFFLKVAVTLGLLLLAFLACVRSAFAVEPVDPDTLLPWSPAGREAFARQPGGGADDGPPVGEYFENRAAIRPYDLPARQQVWAKLHALFLDTAPVLGGNITSNLTGGGYDSALLFEPHAKTPYRLPQHLTIAPRDLAALRHMHENFTERIVDLPGLPLTPGSRGIVTSATKEQVPVLLTSLHVLRHTESALPVEVYLRDDELSETPLCREILPFLRANCIPLSRILASSLPAQELSREQLKFLTLLFTSFQDVLLLDPDNLALADPAKLFDAQPYKETGLLLWPDYWKMTYSPSFYNVTGRGVPSTISLPSVDAGQVAVSKLRHERMLYLAAYYNFFGPHAYYTLLTQGAGPSDGSGREKETFVSAAMRVNEPFYTVSTGPRAFHYSNAPGHGASSWAGATLHTDPLWDYTLPVKKRWEYSWPDRQPAPANTHLFLHATQPQLEPRTVVGEKGLAWKDGKDGKAQPKRIWEDQDEMMQ
ncbi:hypothetical protein KEM52_001372, partial [Ascosphaera acerosa]